MRWVVRAPLGQNGQPLGPDTTVVADKILFDNGVMAFWSGMPGSGRYVRVFGVGQWRDVEPLAEAPPEHTGVVREPKPGVAESILGKDDPYADHPEQR